MSGRDTCIAHKEGLRQIATAFIIVGSGFFIYTMKRTSRPERKGKDKVSGLTAAENNLIEAFPLPNQRCKGQCGFKRRRRRAANQQAKEAEI